MKYYSDKLDKIFNEVKDLEEAEKAYDEKHALELKKKEERAARAKEVDEARKTFLDLLDKFIKDYGYYHSTIDGEIFDLLRWPF